MKTHRMCTGTALLILQRWNGHPITGYENPQNEYRYSSTHSSTLNLTPYNRLWKPTEWVQVKHYSFFNIYMVTLQQAMTTHRMSTGIALLILQHLHSHPITDYENPQNEYRYSSTHSSTFTWSTYNLLWKSTEWVQVQLYSFFNVDMFTL